MTLRFPAPAVNLDRHRRPSLRRAIRAIGSGSWSRAELERDISQATLALYGTPGEDAFGGSAVHLPASVPAYLRVLEELDVRTDGSAAAAYATRALAEGTPSITASGTGGLVGFQTLSDSFALALTANVVVKRMPEVEVIPVVTKSGILPTESAIATTTAVAENTVVSSSDPTFAPAAWSLSKLIALRTLSSEVFDDMADPDAWLNRILSRDIALLQDSQILEGSGAGANITGIRNRSGLTTSSWTAGANGSTPAADDLVKMVFDIYLANATPTGWIMAPRTLQNIALLKDSSLRPIFTADSLFADRNGGGAMYPRCAGSLLGLPVYVTTTVPTNETQGTSNAATHIFCGDFSQLKIVERAAVTIQSAFSDPSLRAPGLETVRLDLRRSNQALLSTDQELVTAGLRTSVAIGQPKAFSVSTGII